MAHKNEWSLKESLQRLPYIAEGQELVQQQLADKIEQHPVKEITQILKEIELPYSGLNKRELVRWLSYNLAKDYPTLSSWLLQK